MYNLNIINLVVNKREMENKNKHLFDIIMTSIVVAVAVTAIVLAIVVRFI